MGRIRGKRNRDQDRYWHERRKAEQSGMVGALDAEMCSGCNAIAPTTEMVHGWCQVCMSAWTATADPVMVAQAAAGYSPASCLPAPSERDVQRILEEIFAPKDDKEFMPLLLFKGGNGGTVGRMQALWNFCKTMELLEIKTTADVLRLSVGSHDAVHRCGLHAPVPRSTLSSFFSRVFHAENFKPIQRDIHLHEYMRWFADFNRMLVAPRQRISAIAEWKTRRDWRRFPRIPYKPLTVHWPFLHKEAAKDHLDIMLVDSLIPKGIPEQWRQDMCQDLFVAVLSGEVKPDELRSGARERMKAIWAAHPYKYFGTFPLDAPLSREKKDETFADTVSTVDWSRYISSSPCAEEVEQRTVGTLGEALRHKHNGVAIPDLKIDHPELIDEEVAEVYLADIGGKRVYEEGRETVSGLASNLHVPEGPPRRTLRGHEEGGR